ncbi:MAG: hypothetical protein RLZ10_1658 [Bacteroidota bacterium]|jgi:hypothetical protein
MKKILITFFILSLFVLASCSSVVCAPNPLEKQNDIINKPTNTVVAHDTVAELPKGSWVKTDLDEKTQVVLEEDTLVYIKPEIKTDPPSKPQEVILPKNTSIILPENTYLQTSDQTKVKLEASTQVTLPVGTEITITKVNWYAILFYSFLVVVAAWYYMQNKNEDKNQDGYVDEESENRSKS